jgi:LPS sulfotransferase NodH
MVEHTEARMVGPLTEQQVNGAEFDQRPSPLKTKILICSTPRSGSYLLCRAMIQNGIGVPHEYFNGGNASIMSSRWGIGTVATPELERDGAPRRAYIAALLEHRTVNGIFAAKIQGGQFAQYFKNAPSDLFENARFIFLYRADLLAQAISFHVSLLTGRWGIDNTVTTTPSSNPSFFDNALVADRMQTLANQDMEWRLLFARNAISPLFLSYEGILKDGLGVTMREILASFDLKLAARIPNYIELRSGDPDASLKSQIRERFTQATAQFTKPDALSVLY